MFKVTFVFLALSLIAVYQVDTLHIHIHNPFKHIHNPLKHLKVRQVLDHLKDDVEKVLKEVRGEVNKLKTDIRALAQNALKKALDDLTKSFAAYILQIPEIQKIVGTVVKAVQCAKDLEKQIKDIPSLISKDLQKYVNDALAKLEDELEKGLKNEKDVRAIIAELEKLYADEKNDHDDDLLKQIEAHNTQLPAGISSAAAASIKNANQAVQKIVKDIEAKIKAASGQGQQLINTMKNCAKIIA